MALVNCEECGARISNQAKRCPHCGVEIISTADAVGATIGMGFGIVCVIVIGMMAYLFFSCLGVLGI